MCSTPLPLSFFVISSYICPISPFPHSLPNTLSPSLFSSGLDHVSCALPLHDLAVNLQSQRRDLEAEIMFRRAVQVRPYIICLVEYFENNMNILSFLGLI